ncbi:YraN family protein [Pelagibius sp. 7325]|uniref:YraN family protein n=1 Tax=Pelagibius sp. 7325 TaxID=3131994 RepID=UPI0030ED5AE3
MTTATRRRAYTRGRRAERLAAWWLRLTGYRILAQDFRSPVGEIDLVARRGGILAIVEVKHRSRLDSAGEAVTPRQQRRIRRAAELYIQRHPELAGLQPRFDALLLVPRHLPHHLKDAWNADTVMP